MLIKGNTVLIPEVSNKQNHLIAGDNITLENVNNETRISAAGGGFIKSPFTEENSVYMYENWDIEQSQSEANKIIESDIIDFIGFKLNLSFYTDDTKTTLIDSKQIRFDFISNVISNLTNDTHYFYKDYISLDMSAATNATLYIRQCRYDGEYGETPTGVIFEFAIDGLDIPNSGIGYISSQFSLITSKELKVL